MSVISRKRIVEMEPSVSFAGEAVQAERLERGYARGAPSGTEKTVGDFLAAIDVEDDDLP